MNKIYLAIPYSGMEESSFKQANQATALLLNKGNNVFSPISQYHHISEQYGLPGNWEFWEELDLQYVDWCDEVFVIIPREGINLIKNSKGVKAEIDYARKNNKKVTFIKIVNNKIVELDSNII